MAMDLGDFFILLVIGFVVAVVIITVGSPDTDGSEGRLPKWEDIFPGKGMSDSVIPQEVPTRKQIKWTEHAVEAHGEDAQRARDGVMGCDFSDLKVRVCPAGKYGLSVYQWCEPPGSSTCCGTITTISGIEKTSFVRPCYQWHSCK